MSRNVVWIRRIRVVTLAVLAASLSATPVASVPRLISYQGRLTNDQGAPLTTGNYSVTFAIWAAETGGSPLWTETYPLLQVTEGLFTVLLGSTVPLADSLFGQPDRWVSVSVGGQVLSPRTRLASVPYAYTAGSVTLAPTDAPGLCNASATGSLYYDSSRNEPCYCNGVEWVQMDGGGPCANPPCADVDNDGYDSCDPSDPGDTDGLPRDCDDADETAHPGATEACLDGIDNDCDHLVDCADPSCSCISPASGDLVITEIMVNPNAIPDASGEWFEVVNVSGNSFDLDGLIIQDGTGADTIQGSLVIHPFQFVTLAISASPGFTPDHVYGGIILSNTSDLIRLVWGVTLIDQVSYSNGWPLISGASMCLNPSALDAISNDVSTNWCSSSSIFGPGDHGTPGAFNDPCP